MAYGRLEACAFASSSAVIAAAGPWAKRHRGRLPQRLGQVLSRRFDELEHRMHSRSEFDARWQLVHRRRLIKAGCADVRCSLGGASPSKRREPTRRPLV